MYFISFILDEIIDLHNLNFPVTASVGPSSHILVSLIKEALSSSVTSVLTRATWRNIPEDTVLFTVTTLGYRLEQKWDLEVHEQEQGRVTLT
jgi:hypothetical protein